LRGARHRPPVDAAPRAGRGLVSACRGESRSRAFWIFIAKNTTATDRIFTSGPPLLYVHADRIGAVREANIIDEMLGSYAGASDDEKLRPLREQLLRNRPRVVFMDPENAHRKTRHNKPLIQPLLDQQGFAKINEQLYLRP
jgi:hypothetical protein